MVSKIKQLKDRILSNPDKRHALVAAENRNTIAYQLKAMRAERGWTQQQLAEKADMKQAVISKYLNGWDNYSLRTLRRLGRALDVALLVTYVPFSELGARIVTRSYAQIAVPEAGQDNGWPADDRQVTQVAAGEFQAMLDIWGSSAWALTEGNTTIANMAVPTGTHISLVKRPQWSVPAQSLPMLQLKEPQNAQNAA